MHSSARAPEGTAKGLAARSASRTLIVLWLALWQVRARADVLDIPESCGSPTELDREVSTLRAGASARNPRPDVKLTRDGAGFTLEVALPDGVRTLRDPDCRALFRAAIVIAALGYEPALEPVVADEGGRAPDRGPRGEGVGALTSPTPNASPARALRTRTPEAARAETQSRAAPRGHEEASLPAPRPPLRAYAALHGGLAYGAVPDLSAAVGAGVDLRRGAWGGLLSFGYLTPRTHRSGGDGVRVHGLSASLGLAARLVRWLEASLGADLFFLRGQGLSVARPRVDWAVQPTLHAGLSVFLLERGRLFLALGARGLWAPQPSAFGVSGRGSVYVAERFGFQTGLRLGLQFL